MNNDKSRSSQATSTSRHLQRAAESTTDTQRDLSGPAGMARLQLSEVRLLPGQDAVVHAGGDAEVFVYLLAGSGLLRSKETEIVVTEGDFIGIPGPGSARMINQQTEDLVYLTGGEKTGHPG